MPPPRRSRGCILRALWIYFLFVMSTAGVAVGGGYLLAAYWWKQEDKAWAAAGWSMETFAARHPARPDNAAAKRLDELTRPLGIVSATTLPGSSPPKRSDDPGLKAASDHLREMLKGGDDRRRFARPHEVEAFVARHGRDLEAVEAFLLSEGPIEWAADPHLGPAAPVPSLLGLRRVQDLLALRALEAGDRGQAAAAARALEAAWRHALSVEQRPEILSQLIAIIAAGTQNGILRRLPHPPADWRERLAARDWRGRMLAAYQGEAYSWRVLTRGYRGLADLETDGRKTGDRPAGHVVRFVSVPYVRLSFVDANEHIRLKMLELQKGDPCTFDSKATEEALKAEMPRWNIVGKIAVPGIFGAWATMRKAALDDELTRLVLTAREVRRTTGSWTEEPVPSRVCVGVLWLHQRQADGRLRIAPNVELPDRDHAPWPFFVSSDASR